MLYVGGLPVNYTTRRIGPVSKFILTPLVRLDWYQGLVGLTIRSGVPSPRPFTASVCTASCRSPHFPAALPPPETVSEPEKNLSLRSFSLCRGVFQSRSQNVSKCNYSREHIRHIVPENTPGMSVAAVSGLVLGGYTESVKRGVMV